MRIALLVATLFLIPGCTYMSEVTVVTVVGPGCSVARNAQGSAETTGLDAAESAGLVASVAGCEARRGLPGIQ